jgi:serine phosphatase RsbU (regulator of sigma subunit)
MYEADRQPIGIFMKETPFTEYTVQLMPDDIFYLFSDGYYSQFGKENDIKFVKSNFKQLLLDNHKLNMSEQKKVLEKRFDEWKGDVEQTDDVLVIGIKI